MKQMINKLAVVLSVALVCAPMGAMAANKLIVKDATGVIDKMVVTDKGQIGLGTSNPSARLELIDVPGVSRIIVQTIGTSKAGGGAFLGLHNNGTEAAQTLPLINDRLGFHLFGSKNSAGAVLTGGGFQVYAESDWSASAFPTYFTFETAKATTKYERLRITANGNIGINANTPKQRLEVGGGIRLNTVATKSDPTANTKPDCSNANTNVVSDVRGTLWFTQGASGVADKMEVCAKDAANNYAWVALF